LGLPKAGPGGGDTFSREREKVGRPIGFHPLEGRTGFLGLGVPFGRLTSDQLERLAEAAEASGGELRLTPWRAVLVAPVTRPSAAAVAQELAQHGLIADPADPRLAVAACPGAPDCANASVSTRDDALLLAPLAQRLAHGGIGLHLSGCVKGCARSDTAPVTLVGCEGRYDLVLDGRPGDEPSHRGLTAQQARALLERLHQPRDADAIAPAETIGETA
jgi:precorrin-3B synthase